MFKHFRWVVIVIGFVGLIVGLIASGIFTRVRPNTDVKPPVVGSKESETGSTRLDPQLPQEDLAGKNIRESKRHAAGEVEKYQKRPLEEKVADQELVVERKRAVLANIVRTKGIIYKGTDSFYTTPEEAAKSGQAHEEYVNAKREFEAAQEILQSMKIQLMGEQIAEKLRKQ